jgi:carnitine-CoA ligase
LVSLPQCDYEDEGLAPEDLIAYLKPRLAAYAIPRYLDFVAELPHTENGKVQKPALRTRGITASTWDRDR